MVELACVVVLVHGCFTVAARRWIYFLKWLRHFTFEIFRNEGEIVYQCLPAGIAKKRFRCFRNDLGSKLRAFVVWYLNFILCLCILLPIQITPR